MAAAAALASLALDAAIASQHRGDIDAAAKRVLLHQGTFTTTQRVHVWSSQLRLPAGYKGEALQSAIDAVAQDMPNQRVVRVDAERTRQEILPFRAPAMVDRVCRLLTYYCKAGFECSLSEQPDRLPIMMKYRQGLNELLAPFMMLGGSPGALPDGHIMALLSRFIARFHPRIFATLCDDEFTSLQCSLRLFRLLLQYHDPHLCNVLDQFDAVPELYATPWFVTLFARGARMEVVLPLWDFFIVCAHRPGPALCHCFAVAFLMSHRGTILDAVREGSNASDLPMLLTRLSLTSESHVRAVCASSLDLWAETPVSFRSLIYTIVYSGGPAAAFFEDASGGGSGAAASAAPRRPAEAISPALLARLEQRVAVKISVAEMLVGAGSRFVTQVAAHESASRLARQKLRMARPVGDSPAGSPADGADAYAPAESPMGWARLLHEREMELPPRYFLVDVRPQAEFELGGRLPTAFHLDPTLLGDPERLEALMDGFQALRGVHFAIMGSGDISQWYHAPLAPPSDPAPFGYGSSSPFSGGGGSPARAAAVASPPPIASARAEASLIPTPGSSIASAATAAATVELGAGGVAASVGASANAEGATPTTAQSTAASGAAPATGPTAVPAAVTSVSPLSPSPAKPPTPGPGPTSAEEDEEIVAIRQGFLPLTEIENDDYGATDVTRAVVLYFLQRGFSRVSEVEGGFTALHQHQAHYLDKVLVGHTARLCMVCSGGAAAAEYTRIEQIEAASYTGPLRGTSSGGGRGHQGAGMPAALRPAPPPPPRGAGPSSTGSSGYSLSALSLQRGAGLAKRMELAMSWFASAATAPAASVSPVNAPLQAAASSSASSAAAAAASSSSSASTGPAAMEMPSRQSPLVGAAGPGGRSARNTSGALPLNPSPADTAHSSGGSNGARSPVQLPDPGSPSSSFVSTTAASLTSGMLVPSRSQRAAAAARAAPAAGGSSSSSSSSSSSGSPPPPPPLPPPSSTSSALPPLPPTGPGHASSSDGGASSLPGSGKMRWLVDSYDAEGMPILTETAQLDIQCDDLERRQGTAAVGSSTRCPLPGRASPQTTGPQQAPDAGAPLQRRSGKWQPGPLGHSPIGAVTQATNSSLAGDLSPLSGSPSELDLSGASSAGKQPPSATRGRFASAADLEPTLVAAETAGGGQDAFLSAAATVASATKSKVAAAMRTGLGAVASLAAAAATPPPASRASRAAGRGGLHPVPLMQQHTPTSILASPPPRGHSANASSPSDAPPPPYGGGGMSPAEGGDSEEEEMDRSTLAAEAEAAAPAAQIGRAASSFELQGM